MQQTRTSKGPVYLWIAFAVLMGSSVVCCCGLSALGTHAEEEKKRNTEKQRLEEEARIAAEIQRIKENPAPYIEDARSAVANGKLEHARLRIGDLEAIVPKHPDLPLLKVHMAVELSKQLVDQRFQLASAKAQTTAQEQLAKEKQRQLEDKALLELKEQARNEVEEALKMVRRARGKKRWRDKFDKGLYYGDADSSIKKADATLNKIALSDPAWAKKVRLPLDKWRDKIGKIYATEGLVFVRHLLGWESKSIKEGRLRNAMSHREQAEKSFKSIDRNYWTDEHRQMARVLGLEDG